MNTDKCACCNAPSIIDHYFCAECNEASVMRRQELTRYIQVYEKRFNVGFVRTDDVLFCEVRETPSFEDKLVELDEKDFVIE